MKKKIKHLTQEELKKLCDKYNNDCCRCPYHYIHHNKIDCGRWFEHIKELEVEVDE